MDNGKSPHNEIRKNPSEDSSRSDDSSPNGSMFSQNLELKVTPTSRDDQPVQQPRPRMEAGDRKVYFGIEARKVMDILNGELERLDHMQSSPALVEDLYSSWKTLWEGDDQPPVKDFTGMFEVAYKALSSAGRLERKLNPQEQETLNTLLQAMCRLASGEEGQNFLLWCHTAKSKCSRMNEELNQQVEISGGLSEPELEQEKAEDISSSVDEWFTQVSSLAIESDREERDSGKQQESFQPQEPAVGQQKIEPPAAEVEKPPPVPEKPLSEDLAKVAPAFEEQAEQELPETEEKPEPKEKPEEEELDLFADQEAQAAATVEEVLTEAPAEIPAPSSVIKEKISQQQTEATPEIDLQEESFADTAGIVDLYFSEKCRDMIELIKYNLSRLSGPFPRRTSRILSRYLDQIVKLADDFGYEAFNESLMRMRKLLTELASAGRGENVSLGRSVEGLQTVVAELEREL